LSGTFGRGKMKRMQSTPLFISRPNHKDEIAPVNLSPIFSAESSHCMKAISTHSGLSALSTLYGEKINNFTAKTEVNEFSYWLGPKIASTAIIKNQLDGTYVEKVPERLEIVNLSNKENMDMEPVADVARSSNLGQSVLSDMLNKQNGSFSKASDKISITVNQQSSVWLNASRDYAKEPTNETDDMEELHTELDKILDQLQKLVT